MQISDEMVEAFGNAFWSVNAASKIDGQREHIRSALEAALSTDAEPVAWMRPANIETLKNGSSGAYSFQVSNSNFGGWTLPVYAHADTVKTAPAVSVKALEWYVYENGECTATSVIGKYNIDLLDGVWYIYFNRATTPLANFGTVEKAKSAAQSHYQARILSALSAQVQDVAEEWWVDELKSFWGDSSYQPTLETRRAVLVALNALGVTAPPASKHGDAE